MISGRWGAGPVAWGGLASPPPPNAISTIGSMAREGSRRKAVPGNMDLPLRDDPGSLPISAPAGGRVWGRVYGALLASGGLAVNPWTHATRALSPTSESRQMREAAADLGGFRLASRGKVRPGRHQPSAGSSPVVQEMTRLPVATSRSRRKADIRCRWKRACSRRHRQPYLEGFSAHVPRGIPGPGINPRPSPPPWS